MEVGAGGVTFEAALPGGGSLRGPWPKPYRRTLVEYV